MTKVLNLLYCRTLCASFILCAFFSCVVAPSHALATLAVGQVCDLNSTCGAAATRGDGLLVTQTTSGCAQGIGEYCGAQADHGFNTAPVYAWNICRYITNQLSLPIFVPFGNTSDWVAFTQNVQSNVATLEDCSLPTTYTVSPDASCVSPQFVSVTYSAPQYLSSTSSTTAVVNLGYAPWVPKSPATETVTVAYSCGGLTMTNWKEYETVTYTGLDADVYKPPNPSWSAGTPVCNMNSYNSGIPCAAPTNNSAPTITLTASAPVVTLGNPVTLTWTVTNATSCVASSSDQEADWAGNKAFSGTNAQTVYPALSPTTTYALSCTGLGGTVQKSVSVGTVIVGQCGAANNVAVSNAPTSGLCSAGQASAVTGTGPWTWSCAGSTAATTASCQAPAIGNPGWSSCTMTSNPVIGSFPADGSYLISGTGDSYSLVGSNGTVLMSGYTHNANISGNDNQVIISGASNCVSLNGSNEAITISGYSQNLNLSGGSTTVSISGANDNININLASGSSAALSISGYENIITIVGDGYTISNLSGTGNIINGVPVN